ncbi:MAG: MMPL family transporter [Nocardioides sp.]|uniref:MMPL family transporter n=1 Tax=Nocardioides sp. TaxID=35761 RepID=UPI0039E23D5C
MSTTFLHRLGRATALHPWRTLSAWVLAVTVSAVTAATFGGALQENWDVPDARAQAGVEQLRAHFPASGGSSAQVVLHDDGALDPALVDSTVAEIGTLDHVISVTPRLAEDGQTALIYVRYDVPTTDPDLYEDIAPLKGATSAARDAGVQVEYGGELPGTATTMEGRGEVIGVVVALALLVIAFASMLAAGLPLLTAVIGLAVGSSLVTVLAGIVDVSGMTPTVATMVGLGVGIDYSLLLVTRQIEGLRSGLDPVEAAARATATAGRSVFGAGLTVLVSLLGLKLAKLPTFDAFGVATALTVVAVMLASLTLVPAMAAKAGCRLLPRKERRRLRSGQSVGGPRAAKSPWAARWAQRISRRPLAWAALSLTILVAIAAPALGMRTWPQNDADAPTSSTLRRAHDLVADAFGPGANAPLTIVVDRSALTDDEVASLHQELADHQGVATSTPVTSSPDGALAVWDIEPTTGPGEVATTDLLDGLRADLLPHGVEVTGYVPILADISDMLADRLWVVIGFVVLVSVLLLTVLLRAPVVAIKAAAMNLLSIGAAYGVMTLVFQHGWGLSLLGMDHTVAVSSWVPILMFAVLFGLSMDYEVFLLSAVREDWLETGDAHGSVVRGLASTARVISIAAAIMVAVFLGFATEANVVVKMVGVGMAAAIALDATLVRLVLVPATMTLLGRWNWWVPGRSNDRTPPSIEEPVEDELISI